MHVVLRKLTAVLQYLLLHPSGQVVQVVAIPHLITRAVPRPEFPEQIIYNYNSVQVIWYF